jgi:hypothetical protein
LELAVHNAAPDPVFAKLKEPQSAKDGARKIGVSPAIERQFGHDLGGISWRRQC